MGKFTKYSTVTEPKKRPWKIHPIWQGIGCLMIILIPIVSYAGAVILVDANLANHWFPIPRDLLGPPGNPLLYTQLGVTVLFSLFGFLVFVVAYSFVYRFSGPSKYGPMDSPPIRVRKVKKRTKK